MKRGSRPVARHPFVTVVTLASATVAFLALWIVATGQHTACTDQFRCTTSRCPARCEIPERVLLASLPALAAAGTVTVWLVRTWGRWSVGVAPLVVVTIAAPIAMTTW